MAFGHERLLFKFLLMKPLTNLSRRADSADFTYLHDGLKIF